MKLTELGETRVNTFKKLASDEAFLEEVNESLAPLEQAQYKDCPGEFPILIVCGVPRSGSTLMAQLLAHSLDVGYINHLIARFWLAPVTGIRLSRSLFGDEERVDFQSTYARTQGVTNLHAFGYFWRHWLKVDSLLGPQGGVDWCGLRTTLLNMERAFGRGMCLKGSFCTYFISELIQQIPRVLIVYITRDPLDTMVSILDGRMHYYGNTSGWFSVSPREYPRLRDLSDAEQIVGQVYYLRKEFERHAKVVAGLHIVRVSLEELCSQPRDVLERIGQACREFCKCDLPIVVKPPLSFQLRQPCGRETEIKAFQRAMKRYPGDLW